jgi:predicted ATPase
VLTSFTLANFKSYELATLPLAPLTVLVGANAAGKSNLIEALQLLAWLASGRRLADLANAIKTGELAIRGRLADLALIASEPLGLACRLPAEGDASALELELSLRTDNGGPRIVEEQLAPRCSSTRTPNRCEARHTPTSCSHPVVDVS